MRPEDSLYLVKMSVSKAQKNRGPMMKIMTIMGVLKDEVKEEYEDKYSEEEIADDEPSDDYDD